MRARRTGIVESIAADRRGAQEAMVRLEVREVEAAAEAAKTESAGEGAAATGLGSELRRALNLTALTGPVVVGQRVLLNTLAVEMGLGTGGLDFVVAVGEGAEQKRDETPPGHILKLRYTPLQIPVLAVEAPESPHHETLAHFDTLGELPVVCLELHSQLPAICAAAHWAWREAGVGVPPRVVYVMTDGAALPLALSRLVPQLQARGLLAATITSGQAFGGDYEAVNLYSALACAQAVAHADIIVAGQGPGNVGTGTPLGFSGIDQGLAINAAASLGGVPIAVARLSFADARARHQGLSHHSRTVLQTIARAPALLPLPRLPEPQRSVLQVALEESGLADLHEPITVQADRALDALIETGLTVTTMGRGLAEERPFFLAAAAAGVLAAQIAESRRS